MLRRRLQRRLEESIRNGTALPPSNRSKSIGPKPVMWEVLLESRDDEAYDIKDWQHMKVCRINYCIYCKLSHVMIPQPVSASIHGFNVDPSSDPSHEQSRSAPLASSPTTSQQSSSSAWRMFRKTPRRAPPPSNASPSQVEAQEFPLDAQEEGTMQVVTLVSMPALEKSEMYQTVKGKERTPASSGMFTGDLPDVVFGITQVPWNGGRT